MPFPASDATAFASAAPSLDPAPRPTRSSPTPAGGRDGLPVGGRRDRWRVGRYPDGSVAIAAITSCTNTSNPTVMVGAGSLARNASRAAWPSTVKTSLAPGSRAVTGYLEAAGLHAPLEALGFALAGYGCTTCIGNSGPLDEAVAAAVEENDLVVAAVLSEQLRGPDPPPGAGLRTLPRRRWSRSLAGRVDIDLTTVGVGSRRRAGLPCRHLAEPDEIRSVIGSSIDPELFRRTYATVFDGDDRWRALPIPSGDRYAWDGDSTYVAKPPFVVDDVATRGRAVPDLTGLRVLAVLGELTHHLPRRLDLPLSPAGLWLQEHGVSPLDFKLGTARGAATTT